MMNIDDRNIVTKYFYFCVTLISFFESKKFVIYYVHYPIFVKISLNKKHSHLDVIFRFYNVYSFSFLIIRASCIIIFLFL